MSADWKQIIAGVAPALATVLGGPLAGGAVKILADTLAGGSTGDLARDETRVMGVLSQGLTPDLQAKILEAEQSVKMAMIQAGIREKELVLESDKAQIADAAHARTTHQQNAGVMRLGYLINVASYSTVAAVLWGCFRLMTGTELKIDPGTAAVVGSIVGAAVQWIMANAQQANGFFFGSSPGSRAKDMELGRAAAKGVKRAAKG